MSDATFNNPTTTLPQQGLGVAGRVFATNHLYIAGGVHDANGKPSRIDFESFFSVREYFTWIEVGWAPELKISVAGQGLHVTLWNEEERVEAGIPSSRGVTFSFAQRYGDRWLPLIRAGYSEGIAPLVNELLAVGLGVDIRTDDMFGVSLSWGEAPGGVQLQLNWESFYRLQLTTHIQVSPGIQWTYHPAYNANENLLRVASVLRIRIAI